MSEARKESVESSMVVDVPVGENHRPEIGRCDPKDVHIVNGRVRTEPGVVQHRLASPIYVDCEEQR